MVGKPFSEEKYGIGLKKGDTALCEKINDAIKKMIADGSWQKAVDANLGPAGYKPGAGQPAHAGRLLLTAPPRSVCRPLTRGRAAYPVVPPTGRQPPWLEHLHASTTSSAPSG